MKKNIFISGGAGYIGSHCVISLVKNGYNPIILDNFSNSNKSVIKSLQNILGIKIKYYDVDLKDKKKLRSIFKKHSCFSVIHCAGFKSVDQSINKPISYFDNNIGSTLSLLECMEERGVFKLIFSSSANLYNEDQPMPLKETAKIGNTRNPYGNSKYITERILIDLAKHDSRWRISIARYFNPIGSHASGLLQEFTEDIPSNLMPYLVKVAQKKLPYLKVFGKNYNTKDGTCLRDYIHVTDLANGHIALLKNNRSKKNLNIYNFGTGKGSSVLEVIKTFEKQNKISIPYRFTKRRKGDAAVSYCDPKKALKELNWKAKFNLNQAIKNILK